MTPRARLHCTSVHKQRGQIVPLTVMCLLPLTMLLALVFNSGEQLTKKSRLQDASDAAVMTQAAWTARSLNIMSMNNVATTQTHAVNIITTTMLPELALLSADVAAVVVGHIKEARSTCPKVASACLTGYWACLFACGGFYAGFLLHLHNTVIEPLADIFKDLRLGFKPLNFNAGSILFGDVSFNDPFGIEDSNIWAFADMAVALSQMNQFVAEDVHTFSKKTVAAMSRVNGIANPDEDLMLYAAYAEDPYGLPLKEIDGSVTKLGSDPGTKVENTLGFQLCKTGYFGTSIIDPTGENLGVDYNFYEHGYSAYTGPFRLGKRSASGALRVPRRGLGHSFHSRHRKLRSATEAVRFDKWIDVTYLAGCSLRGVIKPPLKVSVEAFENFGSTLKLWGIENPRSLFDYAICAGCNQERSLRTRTEWSLVAFARSGDSAPAMMPGWFELDGARIYAGAQAEVYNSVFYDLYTSDWRAKLTPLHMLSIDDRPKRELLESVAEFDERLSTTLLKNDDLGGGGAIVH